MAKSGFIWHRKNRTLARLLGYEEWATVGLCECLWDSTANRQPRGTIGVLDDQEIADEVGWRGDPEKLIEALVGAKILRRHPEFRLVCEGWSEHAQDRVRKRLERAGETFWDGAPPWPDRARRKAAAEEPAGHVPPPATAGGTHPAAVETHPADGSLPSRTKPDQAVPDQARPRREAGVAGGRPRPAPTPPARPPSLADSIDHDPDDPDQRRLAERLASIERQIAQHEGRPPSPRELRKLLSVISTPPGGNPLDSLRRAGSDWLAVTYAVCGRFEREYSPPLLSPEEIAEAWIDARGGPSVVALGVRGWLETRGRDEPLEVAVERWALEPGDTGEEVPPGVVEILLPHLRGSKHLPARGAA
ncbi:MAG: hypothetical protein KJ067_23275 [Vicinamibacteria bacterium]|nr:hypothetical protein [Vicinamibacteria bacterium]